MITKSEKEQALVKWMYILLLAYADDLQERDLRINCTFCSAFDCQECPLHTSGDCASYQEVEDILAEVPKYGNMTRRLPSFWIIDNLVCGVPMITRRSSALSNSSTTGP